MISTQIPSFYAEDNRTAHVENGRWQCDLSFAIHRLSSCFGASTCFPGSQPCPAGSPPIPHLSRRTGHDSMNEQQRVVPVSLTVLFDSFIDYRTLGCFRRAATYRLRRNKKSTKKRETSFAVILMVTMTFCQHRVSPTVSSPPAIPLFLILRRWPSFLSRTNLTRRRRANQSTKHDVTTFWGQFPTRHI